MSEIPVVLINGSQLGAVTKVDRESMLKIGVADFQPNRVRVKVCGTHTGLCPINDGAGRRFTQIGTGIFAVSGLHMAIVLFTDKHKAKVIGSVPLKFILPLPSRRATA